MDLNGNWSYPTSVRFGAGRISELPDAVKTAEMTKPLFVTDPNLAAMPMVSDAMTSLTAAGLSPTLFTDIRANPVGSNITSGTAAFKAGGHDGVIAFGGGSALDAGKLIALMVGQTRPIWEFEDVGEQWR